LSIRDLIKTAPSKDVVRLLLLRHGELDAAPGTVIGDTDLGFSPRGKEQMEIMRRLLVGVGLQAFYTSELRRGKETARLVLEGRSVSSVNTETKALREQSFGAWQGRTWDWLRASDPAAVESFLANPADARPPGGESLAEVRQRVLTWWKSLHSKHRGATVMVATSLSPIRSFLCEALDLPLSRASRFVPSPGSLTVLDVSASVWIVHSIGA
jgi:broad specificity phosphatase PhoE